jgi:hypothetical protein
MHGNATHGMSKTAIYAVWCSMRQRCADPRHRYYRKYGGAGVTVCSRWDSFENFYADMGDRPSPRSTLERKENSIGYQPDNCVWASRRDQAINRRSTIFVTHLGRTQCLKDWARELGINYLTLYTRINRKKLSFEEAICVPIREH